MSPASAIAAAISASLSRPAGAAAAEHVEALALGGEPGAAADGGDDQCGQGDRPVIVAVVEKLRIDDRRVRFGDVGDVLPGGDEQRGEAVRGVRAVVRRPGQESPGLRNLAGVEEIGAARPA